MENQYDIYKTFKKELLEELEKEKTRAVVDDSLKSSRLEPLFAFSSDEEKLYFVILKRLEMVAELRTEILLKNLSEFYGYNFKTEPLEGQKNFRFDLTGVIEGKESFIELKVQIRNRDTVIRQMLSYQELMPGYLVLLVKDGAESRNYIESFRTDMEEAGVTKVKVYLFEEFLGEIFDKKERDRFRESMQGFKNEINKVLGYQLTQLCSPQNWKKLKNKLIKKIPTIDFDKIKSEQEKISSEESTLILSDLSYNKMKDIFLYTQQRYKVLLGDRDFAISFMSSEWIYSTFLSVDSPLDVTYVATGYLKSIEQLLWDIISIVGQNRNIGYKNKYFITNKNKNKIKVTLGNMDFFLKDEQNKDLFREAFDSDKENVIAYVAAELEDWTDKERNGYFHKHNLQSKKVIDEIRDRTYFLYLLILGSLKLSSDVISRLEG